MSAKRGLFAPQQAYDCTAKCPWQYEGAHSLGILLGAGKGEGCISRSATSTFITTGAIHRGCSRRVRGGAETKGPKGSLANAPPAGFTILLSNYAPVRGGPCGQSSSMVSFDVGAACGRMDLRQVHNATGGGALQSGAALRGWHWCQLSNSMFAWPQARMMCFRTATRLSCMPDNSLGMFRLSCALSYKHLRSCAYARSSCTVQRAGR